MEREIHNIRDIYSLKDILIANQIKSTFYNGYCPVALVAPGHTKCGYGEMDLYNGQPMKVPFRVRSLKLHYAVQVWHMANALEQQCSIRDGSEGYMGGYLWGGRNKSFNELHHVFNESYNKPESNISDSDAIVKRLYRFMRRICDKKIIKVSEGYSFTYIDGYNIDLDNDNHSVLVVLDREGNDIKDFKLDEKFFEEDKFDSTRRCYSWNEIRDFFVTVSPLQMELLHLDKINGEDPDAKDLFQACEALDASEIKKALAAGANVLALDGRGQSAVTVCVERCWRKYESENVGVLNKAKECIDVLLAHGADINLFGYGRSFWCGEPVTDVLSCAVHIPDASFLEYLLEKGASPNYNSDMVDMINRPISDHSSYEWKIQSSALHELVCHTKESESEKEALEQVLKKYGAKLYIDGYDPDMSEDDEQKLIQNIIGGDITDEGKSMALSVYHETLDELMEDFYKWSRNRMPKEAEEAFMAKMRLDKVIDDFKGKIDDKDPYDKCLIEIYVDVLYNISDVICALLGPHKYEEFKKNWQEKLIESYNAPNPWNPDENDNIFSEFTIAFSNIMTKCWGMWDEDEGEDWCLLMGFVAETIFYKVTGRSPKIDMFDCVRIWALLGTDHKYSFEGLGLVFDEESIKEELEENLEEE